MNYVIEELEDEQAYQMGMRGVGTHRKRLAHTLKEFSINFQARVKKSETKVKRIQKN